MTKHFTDFRQQAYAFLASLLPDDFLRTQPLFCTLKNTHQSPDLSHSEDSYPEQLNHLFSTIYWRTESNRHGVVFTPRALRRHLLKGLSLKDVSMSEQRVLDPAIGGGMLLTEMLTHQITSNQLTTAQAASDYIKQSLFGVDQSAVAIEVTRISLLLVLVHFFPKDRALLLQLFDTWKKNFMTVNGLLFDPSFLFPAIPNGFTHIIGNPPYGLSRNDQIAPPELQQIKKRYRYILSGKPNKYMLFIARAIELLGENGMMSFLVPNSWLGIASGTALRKYLLSNGYLRNIDCYKNRAFGDRGVETVILTLQKSAESSFTVHTWQSAQAENHITSITHKNRSLLKKKDAMIPIGWSEELRIFWEQVELQSIPMIHSQLTLKPLIALQVYATGKGNPPQTKQIVKDHPFHSRTPNSDPNQYRYLHGRDVSRYKISWSGEYLNYGPWVSEFQPRERYMGPRIVIREILGNKQKLFQAAYTEEPYLYNKSILHIIPHHSKSGDITEQCLALLALLNSSFGSLYLRSMGKKCQRGLFPKIVNQDLKNFPIPQCFFEVMPYLAEQAQRLSEEDTDETDLNKKIFEFYGVAERNLIEESLSR